LVACARVKTIMTLKDDAAERGWDEARPTARLLLADGTLIEGEGLGAEGVAAGELCFNTAMTGYQEILTDPSYAGQIITFTFPHIGNVGVNEDDVETVNLSASSGVRGAVFAADVTEPSNWRATRGLDAWLKARGIVAITGVDTRALTALVREKGMPNAVIGHAADGAVDEAALRAELERFPGLEGQDLVPLVGGAQRYGWEEGAWGWPGDVAPGVYGARPEGGAKRVVAIDYGLKRNILRLLTAAGCEVTVLPATATADDVLALEPDGVFLSNGPGDPAATGEYAVPMIQGVLDQKVPTFGICLGHQMLALAVGAKTAKMRQGHHGANHPVKDLTTGKVEIVSMNHGFAVDRDTLPAGRTAADLSSAGSARQNPLDEPRFVQSVARRGPPRARGRHPRRRRDLRPSRPDRLRLFRGGGALRGRDGGAAGRGAGDGGALSGRGARRPRGRLRLRRPLPRPAGLPPHGRGLGLCRGRGAWSRRRPRAARRTGRALRGRAVAADGGGDRRLGQRRLDPAARVARLRACRDAAGRRVQVRQLGRLGADAARSRARRRGPSHHGRARPVIRARVVVALGFSQLVSWGVTYYLVGVFGTRIAADLGWSLAAVQGGFAAGLLVMALASPLAGRLIERHGGRRAMTAGSFVGALGCALLSAAESPLAYYAAWIVIGLAMRLTLYDAAFAALARIGGAGARRAMAQITLLGGFASTVFWPLGDQLADLWGWRGAMLAYAGFSAATALLHWAIPDARHEPETGSPLVPNGSIPPGLDDRERRLAALLYALAAALVSALNSAMSAHMIGLLAGLGLGLQSAVWTASLRGFGQTAARGSEVLFGARLRAVDLNLIAAALLALCFLVALRSGVDPWAAVAFVLMFGAGNGLSTITRGTLPLAFFDAATYGSLVGRLIAPKRSMTSA
jgi:carbamoyl-phosphate synthase small subunit